MLWTRDSERPGRSANRMRTAARASRNSSPQWNQSSSLLGPTALTYIAWTRLSELKMPSRSE
eukprot:12040667-Alexandrium_andersonii.AAC.1